MRVTAGMRYKIVVWCVEGSDFQKAKEYAYESYVMIVCTIDVDDVIYEGYKTLVEEHRRIG